LGPCRNNDLILVTGGYTIYFGVKDNNIIITDDEESYNFFKSPIDTESLKSSELYQKLKSSPFFFYTNFDFDSYPNDFKNYIQHYLDFLGLFNTYKSIFEIYNYLTVESTKNNKTHIKIHLNDSKENSLFTILHNIDKVIGEKVNM
jgi:hypothetical protein